MQRIHGKGGQARLVAVGDVMIGDSAVATGFGFASRYAEGQGVHVLSELGRLFDGADLVLGNLEGSLSQIGHSERTWSSTQFRGKPAFAGALRNAGFRVMSVANNHAAQHGVDAFVDTVHLLRDAGIECCGIRGSQDWCSEPVMLSVNGLRIGLLGYCMRPRQYSARTPPYAEGIVDEVCEDVDRLRREVNQVVTSLHWGEEFVTRPSVSEVRLAHRINEAGSAVIVGHHPHVRRPIELVNGGIIAYSLGNFVSDMIWYKRLRSAIMVSVLMSGESIRAETTPLWIGDTYLPMRNGPPGLLEKGPIADALTEREYAREVARTVRENRIASYAYALRNAWRFRTPTLRQLIGTTLRSKLSSRRMR